MLRSPGRLRRALLAALVVGAVALPLTAGALPGVPAPAPARFPVGTPAAERFEVNAAGVVTAARMAEEAGRDGRAAALRRLARERARLLFFDGHGAGRIVEVFGDVSTARRVAVLVPGSDTSIETYERFRAGAVALYDRMRKSAPRSAVVTWLGYETPGTVSPAVVTTGRAEEAARALGPFLQELSSLTPAAELSLLCHSYGSVVCARVSGSRPLTDVVLFGSPGTGFGSVAELPTGAARVWAGRGASDWIGSVPHTRVELPGLRVGFGRDPVDPAFGAQPFTAGEGGHSDYLKPGTESLESLARIALGPHASSVSVAHGRDGAVSRG
ncbi:alpha/beta hydrolase [Streptomyces sp. NPDC097619]|uniref:alpha/beta hydrolase n=1 Tax=Streptomyces sp. NPDC097619 TaxID=3157228 RepID=UPI00331772B4